MCLTLCLTVVDQRLVFSAAFFYVRILCSIRVIEQVSGSEHSVRIRIYVGKKTAVEMSPNVRTSE